MAVHSVTKDIRKALTWLQGCHTGIRHGPMQGAVGNATANTLVSQQCFFFPFQIHADSHRPGADSGRFALIQVESVCISWPKPIDSGCTSRFRLILADSVQYEPIQADTGFELGQNSSKNYLGKKKKNLKPSMPLASLCSLLSASFPVF